MVSPISTSSMPAMAITSPAPASAVRLRASPSNVNRLLIFPSRTPLFVINATRSLSRITPSTTRPIASRPT